ncbi:serine/threonine-protein kinase [Archangium lansingense]|uniref:non-specific serine/threonine protein kinase n=1 Tax=Archangium lansingense TaxID=2995310 RepID=A0ABT3ZZA3_9BACT|nr:serine/threonine-protein kinase [Archangium lansinium]MCY1074742.1 serine/threonine-protein kinase [Archangium lansinium]
MESRMIDGRYVPLQQLGRGGYGSVFLVQDSLTNRRVALKFLMDASADAVTRFQREARLLGEAANNRYVVELLGCNLKHTPPYLVLEYCEYGSLRSWVGAQRPWQDVAAALTHALNGLHGIHAAGGFHRDLKPDNLLVTRHPEQPTRVLIKIGDLGLARTPGPETQPMTRNAAGTEGYIAPEIKAGAPFQASADIYSLGIVAAELLTGERSTQKLGQTKLPEQMRAMVRSMLSANPRERPSAQQLAQTLTNLLQDPHVIAETEEQSSGIGGVLITSLLAGGALLALAALAGGDEAQWDERVQRFRGPDGKFKSE